MNLYASRIKKWIVILLSIVYICLVFIAIRSLSYGKANFFVALVLYCFPFFSIDFALVKIFRESWAKNKFRLSFYAILIAIIISETGLRYVTKSNLSYSEENGKINYYCPYSEYNQEIIKIGEPNSIRNEKTEEFEYVHKYNSNGLRNIEVDLEHVNEKKVVLALGDSFTEGIGAPQDSSWPALLNDILYKKDTSYICINAGIAGSDVVYENYKLQKLLYDLYKPDIVIIAINTSDIDDVIYRGGRDRFSTNNELKFREGPWWKEIYAFSHIFRLVANRIFGIERYLMTSEQYAKESSIAIEKIYNEISDNLLPYSAKNKIDIIVVLIPTEYDLTNNNSRFDKLINLMEKNDSIDYIDIAGVLNKRNILNYDLIYWQRDLHFNSNGYKIVAEEIANKID